MEIGKTNRKLIAKGFSRMFKCIGELNPVLHIPASRSVYEPVSGKVVWLKILLSRIK